MPRPALITTVAIIGIVLGSLGILSGLSGLASVAFQSQLASLQTAAIPPEQLAFQESMIEAMQAYRVPTAVGNVLNLIASTLLVVGGALAFRQRPDAGRLLLWAVIASIVVDLFVVVVGFLVQQEVMPLVEEMTRQMAGDLPGGGEAMMDRVMSTALFAGVAFSALFFLCKLAYYIVAIVAMTGRKAKAWYAGEAAA